jgi:hypothetical protein
MIPRHPGSSSQVSGGSARGGAGTAGLEHDIDVLFLLALPAAAELDQPEYQLQVGTDLVRHIGAVAELDL